MPIRAAYFIFQDWFMMLFYAKVTTFCITLFFMRIESFWREKEAERA